MSVPSERCLVCPPLDDVHSIMMAHCWGRPISESVEYPDGERFVSHRFDLFGCAPVESCNLIIHRKVTADHVAPEDQGGDPDRFAQRHRKEGKAAFITEAEHRIDQLAVGWSFLWDKRRSLWIAAEDRVDGEQLEEVDLDVLLDRVEHAQMSEGPTGTGLDWSMA